MPVDCMELDALVPLVGRAWTFGDRITGEQVLPALRVAPGDFLVAGQDFGAGSASEATAQALRVAGVAAVIGRSFAASFFRAATDAGLPALVVEETGAIKPGDRLRVDIEQRKIANLSSGDRYVIRNLYDESLDILRAGGRYQYLALKAQTPTP